MADTKKTSQRGDKGVIEIKPCDVVPPNKTKANKIDKDKLKKMIKGGMKQVEAAKIFGVTVQAVNQVVKQFQILPHAAEFRENKVEILEQIQADTLLHGLNTDKIKAASAKDAAVIFGVIDDKIRLERGQATQIMDVQLRGILASIDLDKE